MTLQPGETIEGKYRIVRLLGEGGMGSVYEGENVRIHRRVAIKVLHAAVAAKGDVVQRFEREAQAAGRIGSEHIVEVLDLGSLSSGERFMVMEFLDGESLGDRIKTRKRLSPHETAPIIYQLLEGLAAAHNANIIHRDLKPDNVFICGQRGQQRDFVKVLDFGVSKFNALDNADMSMTKTGAVMGTPFYMSPEQARGAKIDTRTDLYSVGVVMYQAVTGRLPFHAETFNELVFKIALESPEPPEIVAPGLDRGFAQVIAKAMVRDANGRFQTAREFQAAISQWMMANQSGPEMGRAPFPSMSGMTAGPMMTPSGGAAAFPGHQLTPSNPHFVGGANASGPYAPLGQSAAALNQSGAQAQLGLSQGGLAVTTPKDRGSGVVIAIAALAMVMLAGGGFAAYKLMGHGPAAAETNAPAQPTSPAMPTQVATAAPSETATTAPSPTATPSSTPTEVTTVILEPPVAPTPVPGGRHSGRPIPSAKPSAAPTATPAPTAKPTATGRTVPGEL